MAVTLLISSWLGYEQATGQLVFWDGRVYRPLAEAAGYAAAEHSHSIADVTDLQAALDAKLDLAGGTLTGGLTAASFSTAGTATAALAVIGGTQLMGDGDDLYVWAFKVWHEGNDGPGSGLNADQLDGHDSGYFAVSTHGHAIADVGGLQSALDGKLALAGGDVAGPLGIGGASADATNRLSVTTPAVLINRAVDDVQVKVNKEAAGDTATFLFQTGFSGRAEIGTAGDDNFHFKVSADGSSWRDAIVIDSATGAVRLTWLMTADMPGAVGLDGYMMGVWDGDAGNKCLAVSDGASWRRITLGPTISAT